MTPRTFWDAHGNLWALDPLGFSPFSMTCYLLWHHQHGDEWVTLVNHSERGIMVGCRLIDVVVGLGAGPLVASC